jgi:hypothetical protein
MTERPAGYREPVVVHLVEESDEASNECWQVGGFFAEAEAKKLLHRLHGEGRRARINVMPIHQRVEDYEYDR